MWQEKKYFVAQSYYYPTKNMNYLIIAFKVIAVCVFIIAAIRLFGKKELA